MSVTMKRSTPEVMYVTLQDFHLASLGMKTATSRIGDRRELWPVGKQIALTDNEDEARSMQIEVVYNFVTTLGAVTRAQAGNIGGGYSVLGHFNDFTSVYPGSNGDTEMSLVGFRVLP